MAFCYWKVSFNWYDKFNVVDFEYSICFTMLIRFSMNWYQTLKGSCLILIWRLTSHLKYELNKRMNMNKKFNQTVTSKCQIKF